jgi:hypothetical protein
MIDNKDFIKTISCLNVCLQERTKMKKVLENRKKNPEGYQRYLQKKLNREITNECEKWCECELIPVVRNLENFLKLCDKVCVDHINTISHFMNS